MYKSDFLLDRNISVEKKTGIEMLKEMESKLEQYLGEIKEYKVHYKTFVEKIEAETGKNMRDSNKNKLKNEMEE